MIRHQSLFRLDPVRILRHRVLDRLRAAPHRGGSLDSLDSTANKASSSRRQYQPLNAWTTDIAKRILFPSAYRAKQCLNLQI
jgi:hypothetical protein